MTVTAQIIGNPVSPYVRKVLAACAIKGVGYALDPIVPFLGDERFTAVSPLRRVPVYADDMVTLCDSSVICQYLEDRWPSPSLYPADIAARARARWLEEYADTRLGDVAVWKLFYPAVLAPVVFGAERDADARAKTLAEDVPDVCGYLEAQAPADGFLCGELSIADIALAVHFANMEWARAPLDAARYPKLGAWLERTLAATPLGRLKDVGAQLIRVPPQAQRAKLDEFGIAVMDTTVSGTKPRKGPMTA